MLNDPEIRLALARAHADDLRQQMAAARRAGLERVPLRWRLGRLLVAAGLRLTREAPLTWPGRERRPSVQADPVGSPAAPRREPTPTT